MFTVLNIEKRIYRGIGRNLVRKLPVNSAVCSVEENEKCSVRYLNYVCRNGRINWKKINKRLEKINTPVVFSGEDIIPSGVTFRPFVPYELRKRLCFNMAAEVLSLMDEVPRRMRVGVYDPEGDYPDIPEYLLRFTDNLVVVTKNYDLYSTQANRLLSETGAVLHLSRNVYSLEKCHFIIAPVVIKEKFLADPSAVILTCDSPSVPLCCRIYHRYSFRLPKEFERLRWENVDTEAFGGALYSLGKFYEIGSSVPFLCMNPHHSHTTMSLKKYFEEEFST